MFHVSTVAADASVGEAAVAAPSLDAMQSNSDWHMCTVRLPKRRSSVVDVFKRNSTNAFQHEEASKHSKKSRNIHGSF